MITLDILSNIRIRVTVTMIHRAIDTVNCISNVTIVTLKSLLLHKYINLYILHLVFILLLKNT